MELKRQPDAVVAPQALVKLPQKVVGCPHALFQVVEGGLKTVSRLEKHAQIPGLRHLFQSPPIALPAVLGLACLGHFHDDGLPSTTPPLC